MTTIKTDNNPDETLSNQELADRLDILAAALTMRLDHLDSGVHEIQQRIGVVQEFIDAHRPALARAMGMLDPGSRLRAAMGRKGHHG